MLAGLSTQYLATMAGAWAALLFALVLFVRLRMWKSARPWLRKAALGTFAAWSILFAAIAAETAFVGLYSTTDAFSLSLVSKRWNERFVARNNWNCRADKRYTGETYPGVKRLAILGDSFAFGHGVQRISDRFGEILDARRKSNPAVQESWEVYNLAEPGANTGWQWEKCLTRLEREDHFRADFVLLAYCLNDVEDLSPDTYNIVGSIINDPPKNYLCREFFLPNFLFYRLNHFRRPEVRGYFGWLENAYRGEIWEKQKARLRRIEDWCKEHNAKFAVAVFPFMTGFAKDYAFEYAHEALGAYFKERGIPCLDLLPVYRKHANETLTVNPFDAHPNERAHRLAADAIEAAGLLPWPTR